MPNNWSLNNKNTWHNPETENNNTQFYGQEISELQRRMISEIQRLCMVHNIRLNDEQIENLVNQEFIEPLRSKIHNQSMLIETLNKYKNGALFELEKIITSDILSPIQMAIETKKILDANIKLGTKSKEMLKKEEERKNIFDDIFKQIYTKMVMILGGNESLNQDIFRCIRNYKTMLEDDFYSKKSTEIMNIFNSINNMVKQNLSTVKSIDAMQQQNTNSRGSRGFVNIIGIAFILLLITSISIATGVFLVK